MNRPIVILGGWLSTPDDYLGMARILAAPPYSRIVYITQVSRAQWAALRDPDFTPVLDLLAATVDVARRETGSDQVDLIGHSAGGRLARAYLAAEALDSSRYDGQSHVQSLITLGTAHSTVEVWVAQFAGMVNERYPGAFYKHISYRSVAGRGVQGKRIGTLEEMIAWRSYQVSFGNGDQNGDGVIPTSACYLAGADNLIIDGARHVPYNAPRTWYGAPEVVPLWMD
jgi:triacylglycerol esterase/lipase EstA (alpha/beta hydrolase family)